MKSPFRIKRPWIAASFFLLVVAPGVARAQCTAQPSRETALSIINSSSHFIAFYVDGAIKGSAAPGEVSTDFIISPGEHVLTARTFIDGELLVATRKLVIPAGSICTWSVTNPKKSPAQTPNLFQDFLARTAVITLASLN